MDLDTYAYVVYTTHISTSIPNILYMLVKTNLILNDPSYCNEWLTLTNYFVFSSSQYYTHDDRFCVVNQQQHILFCAYSKVLLIKNFNSKDNCVLFEGVAAVPTVIENVLYVRKGKSKDKVEIASITFFSYVGIVNQEKFIFSAQYFCYLLEFISNFLSI